MHSRNADTMRIIPHQITEKIRPVNQGNALLRRCGKLGIFH